LFYGGKSMHLFACKSLCLFFCIILNRSKITTSFYVHVCRHHLGMSWRTHWPVYWVFQTTWRIRMIIPLSAQLLYSGKGTRGLGGEDIDIIISMQHCEGPIGSLLYLDQRYLLVQHYHFHLTILENTIWIY
jgi:hypothetical protein